jgi:hypothetical protein
MKPPRRRYSPYIFSSSQITIVKTNIAEIYFPNIYAVLFPALLSTRFRFRRVFNRENPDRNSAQVSALNEMEGSVSRFVEIARRA